jgi:hypothetical protein
VIRVAAIPTRYPDAHYAAQKTWGKLTGTEAFMIQSGIAVTSPNRRPRSRMVAT